MKTVLFAVAVLLLLAGATACADNDLAGGSVSGTPAPTMTATPFAPQSPTPDATQIQAYNEFRRRLEEAICATLTAQPKEGR